MTGGPTTTPTGPTSRLATSRRPSSLVGGGWRMKSESHKGWTDEGGPVIAAIATLHVVVTVETPQFISAVLPIEEILPRVPLDVIPAPVPAKGVGATIAKHVVVVVVPITGVVVLISRKRIPILLTARVTLDKSLTSQRKGENEHENP